MGGGQGSGYEFPILMVIMALIFWFMLIRPQRKDAKRKTEPKPEDAN